MGSENNTTDLERLSQETQGNRQTAGHDSLLGCLMIACRHHQIAVTVDAITSGLPLKNGKLTPALFKRAAEKLNLTVSVLKKPITDIRDAVMPVTLMLEGEEACQLIRIDKETQQAWVIYPELGDTETQVPLETLNAQYLGYYIVTKPKFVFDQRTPEVGKVKLRHWFWGTIAQNKSVYRDVMVAALVVNVFALAMPLFTMNVYDRIVPNRAVETLWVMAIGVFVIILGDLLLRTMRAYFIDWASAKIDVKLSARIMEKVLGTNFDQRPTSVGSFASNLRSFENVRDFITSATITALIDLPFGLIFIGVIAWVNPYMIIPVLVGGLTMIIYALSIQTKMHNLSETMYRAGAVRNATLVESLVGLETIKSLGVEGNMQRKWEESATYLTEVNSRLKLLTSTINNASSAIQQTVNVSIILLGVYLVTAGELTMGGLIASTMLSSRALMPMSQTAGLLGQYHTASTSLQSLDEVMAKPEERPDDANFLSRPAFKGEIEFKNVSFQYPGTEEDALTNVSFKIKAGEHVALLGRMGSGKSTIHKLILGLYKPTEGAILIDGIDSRQIDPAELRRSIGYVQQDTQLFYGSMRENITYRNPHADDQSVLEAASIGGILDFINTHPSGFDLLVGERGETLSGGQRQCVGIARAFLTNPSILLLDEPTSAMDHSGEEAVKQRLMQSAQHKTIFLISHRSGLFDLVSRIIVIDSGKIVADGKKEDIVEALRAGKIGKAS